MNASHRLNPAETAFLRFLADILTKTNNFIRLAARARKHTVFRLTPRRYRFGALKNKRQLYPQAQLWKGRNLRGLINPQPH